MDDCIRVRGAREHNLRAVDVLIPLRRLVVVTGVSGSGKSSLAFDTLHAESQRRYVEALGASIRGLEGGLTRPDVELVEGLPPSVALHQRPRPEGPWDTVGTEAGVVSVLRALWGRVGTMHCPGCDAPVRQWTRDEVVRALLALPEGTRLYLEAPLESETPEAILDEVARAGFSRVRVGGRVARLDELRPAEVSGRVRVVVDRLKVSAGREDRLHDAVRTAWLAGRGRLAVLVDEEERWFSEQPWCATCERGFPALHPRLLSARSKAGACDTCGGTGRVEQGSCRECSGVGVSALARRVRWEGLAFGRALGMTVASLAAWLSERPTRSITEGLPAEAVRRLEQLDGLGLGSLEISRRAGAVATGERQRLRLARQLAARLSGVLYVLDEPTAGLHPRDVQGVIGVLKALVASGNTVVAVEHDAQVILAADHVIDFGPGAGPSGGEVVFQGAPPDLLRSDSLTGQWLSGHRALPATRGRVGRGAIQLDGTVQGRAYSLELPLGALVAVTGPSGSGKSAVLEEIEGHLARQLGTTGELAPLSTRARGLERVRRVLSVGDAPQRSARSMPATYTGLWTTLRGLLAATTEAQIRGLGPASFSLNVRGGRCEACGGAGARRMDLDVLPDISVVCEVCEGRRFSSDVLQVRWKGRAADELLGLTADEAHAVLAGHPKLEVVLRALRDVGLGYLPLGQSMDTLSGGEANRLCLARELARARRSTGEGALFVLDHPSKGLHPADVERLLQLLQLLVDEGATVWMATHDPALIGAADAEVPLVPCG